MKTIFVLTVLLVTLALPGCSWLPKIGSSKSGATGSKTIVTPDMSLAAKVVTVNTAGRFVLLNFPADKMPKIPQTLFIYRAGLKVAEVTVTGPRSENNIVADLVSGEPRVGDTVRAD